MHVYVGDNIRDPSNFSLSIQNSEDGDLHRYRSNQQQGKERTVMSVDFMLENGSQLWIAREHKFNFNESVSFKYLATPKKKLITAGKTFRRFQKLNNPAASKTSVAFTGRSSPAEMGQMIYDKDPEQMARITHGFLQMNKFELAELKGR
jgi:3-demethylubiquinone-9 3-methyltransferase